METRHKRSFVRYPCHLFVRSFVMFWWELLNMELYTHTNKHTYRQIDKQTDRQTDRKIGRPKERQTEREEDISKYICIYDIYIYIYIYLFIYLFIISSGIRTHDLKCLAKNKKYIVFYCFNDISESNSFINSSI